MKKILILLFSLCWVIPAFAAESLIYSTDSLRFYKDSIRYSRDNVKKWEFIKKALDYGQREKDTLAWYSFRLEDAKLFYMQGNYALLFDTLLSLEQAVADAMKRPTLLQKEDISPFQIKKPKDSLWSRLHMETGLQLAEAETYLYEYSEAIEILSNIRIAYSKDTNDYVSGRCFLSMGAIMIRQNKEALAKHYCLRALEILKNKAEKEVLAKVYSNLSTLYACYGQAETALKYALERYDLFSQNECDDETYIYTIFYIGQAYRELKRYEIADGYFEQALQKAIDKQYDHLAVYIRSNLIMSYFRNGQYDKAEDMAKKNLTETRRLNHRLLEDASLRFLSAIYQAKGDYQTGLLYFDTAYSLMEEIAGKEQELRMGQLQRKFDLYKMEQERVMNKQALELANSKLKNRNLLMAIFLLLGILLVITFIIIYHRLRLSYKKNQIIQQHMEKSVAERIHNKNQELIEKDKELTSMALYYVKIRGLVETLREKIKAMYVIFDLKIKEKLYLKEMEHLLKEFDPDKNWNEFELYFKKVDSAFFEQLDQKFPQLTPNEKRLCALLHLNLNSKEIASITGRTLSSIHTAKARLKKKMSCDGNISLYDFLNHL